MPHDLNGNLLVPGDEVIVRFKVKSISPDADPDYCNCNLESVVAMPGNGVPLAISAISTQQTEKVEV